MAGEPLVIFSATFIGAKVASVLSSAAETGRQQSNSALRALSSAATERVAGCGRACVARQASVLISIREDWLLLYGCGCGGADR